MSHHLAEAGTAPAPPSAPRKAIPPARDRRQSAWIVRLLGTLLAASVGLTTFTVVGMSGPPLWFLAAAALSAAFALLVWRLRAATPAAALFGGLICLQTLLRHFTGVPWTQTAFPGLVALFLLTFAAGRLARRRTPPDPRELRHGRTSAQVLANLGLAGIFAASPDQTLFLMVLAALAQATADTVSSELGHALARPTFLLTTLRRVSPGTDGGISLAGTSLGLLAAAAIPALALALGAVDAPTALLLTLAATAGLLFDSLLGATLEGRGWIGNDLVNLLSTLFAALLASQLLRTFQSSVPYW